MVAQLFPIPEQLHAYIDGWVSQANELDAKLAALQKAYDTDTAVLQAEITRLTSLVASTALPLQQQINVLTEKVRKSNEDRASLQALLDAAVRGLAEVLEVSPTAPGVTLQTLITDASLLVTETKTQFRRTL